MGSEGAWEVRANQWSVSLNGLPKKHGKEAEIIHLSWKVRTRIYSQQKPKTSVSFNLSEMTRNTSKAVFTNTCLHNSNPLIFFFLKFNPSLTALFKLNLWSCISWNCDSHLEYLFLLVDLIKMFIYLNSTVKRTSRYRIYFCDAVLHFIVWVGSVTKCWSDLITLIDLWCDCFILAPLESFYYNQMICQKISNVFLWLSIIFITLVLKHKT